MLTVGLPVAGAAYLIRVFSGRTHWASAVLYGLLTGGLSLIFLIEYTHAETPANMSAVAAVVGGMILYLPTKWVPGVKRKGRSRARNGGKSDRGSSEREKFNETTSLFKWVDHLKDDGGQVRHQATRLWKAILNPRSGLGVLLVVLLTSVTLYLSSGVGGKDLPEILTPELASLERVTSTVVGPETGILGGGPGRTKKYHGAGPEPPIEVGWSRELDEISPSIHAVTPPVIVDGSVYIGTGTVISESDHGYVFSLDSETGKEKWRFGVDYSVYSTPTVYGESIYFGNSVGQVYALDAETGNMQWRFEVDGFGPSSPVVVDKTVYVAPSSGVYALNAETGQLQWHTPVPPEGWVSDPAVVGGTVYVGSGDDSDADDHIYAIDAKTGRRIWRSEIGRNLTAADVAALNKTVYVSASTGFVRGARTAHENYVYALSAQNGEERWRFEADGQEFGALAVAETSVYVGSASKETGYVYSLNRVTGQQQWQFEVVDDDANLTFSRGTLYVEDGYLIYALDGKNGRKIWDFRPNNPPSLPVVNGSILYVGGPPGYTFTLE